VSTWAGRRVLVTGAAGFIGARLVHRLLHEGAQVHALVRPGGDLARLRGVRNRVALKPADLRDAGAIAEAVRAAAADVYLHLGAAGVRHDTRRDDELMAVNAAGTSTLLEAAALLPWSRFVHVGGSSEYGPRDHPLRESDEPRPSTAYGAAKAEATRRARRFAQASGRPVVVLRPFSVYGPGEPPSRLVPSAIAAARRGTELPLTVPGFRRDLVHVDDVVEACVRAVERELAPGEVINVGTGTQSANEEVVDAVGRACGRPVRTRPGAYAPRASDTSCWVADTTHAAHVLGWRARRSLDEGLRDTVAWWDREHGTAS
jgi:nucleoside-diphosphate-sugar epimerase